MEEGKVQDPQLYLNQRLTKAQVQMSSPHQDNHQQNIEEIVSTLVNHSSILETIARKALSIIIVIRPISLKVSKQR